MHGISVGSRLMIRSIVISALPGWEPADTFDM